MKFSSLDASVKRQIKASMKRIAEKLIKLNIDKTDTISFKTAFNIWISRYISTHDGVRYYDLLEVDDELFNEMLSTMENIFIRAQDAAASKSETTEVKHSRYYLEKPATEKQLNYAQYLMNMVNNTALPKKRYTMYEISSIINALKKQMRNA